MQQQNLLTQLEKAKNITEINAAMTRYLQTYGIQSYAFTYYSLHPSSRRKLIYDYASKPLRPWHDYYLESGYEDIDATLQSSRKNILPVFWDVQQQLSVARTPRERRIRLESIDYGIDKGLLIPIHGPREEFASFVLHQRMDENGLQDYQQHINEWFTAGYYYYAHLRKQLLLATHKEKKYHLTKRELQCLRLTAENYLARDIAKKLNIKERTVHYHIQNLNKKLGTKNKFQSLSLALAEDLLVKKPRI